MAEEKQEKKRPGIARRIFKWLSLGLLVFLLIAALIFQVPWKAITLLVVILLASTVLPKPARKYFWLSAAGSVIVLIIWVFLPDNSEGWRSYTFDEELAALEAKRAIPDEENAAISYKTLYESYTGTKRLVIPDLNKLDVNDPNIAKYMKLFQEAQPKDTFYPDFWNNDFDGVTRFEFWTSKDYPEVAKWLKLQESTLKVLEQGCEKDLCQLPIDLKIFDSNSIWLAQAIRHWACLFIRSINNDFGDGRIAQALEKQIYPLKIAGHLRQQPSSTYILTGLGIETLVFQQYRSFIVNGNPTNKHLSIIEETLQNIKYDWSSDWLKILEYDKLRHKNLLYGPVYEINSKGKVRLSREPCAIMREIYRIDKKPTYRQRKLTKAGTILLWFFVPSTPQKAAKVVDAVYEKYYAMAEPEFNWDKEPREFSITSVKFNFRYMIEILAGMLEGSCYRIHDRYLRVTTDKRGCLLLIALRRYKNKTGQWPETLDNIKPFAPAEIFIDPFNNDSFVYKLTDDGFTLYSKGKNNIDEAGKRDKWGQEETEPDDWLIWPRKSRKNKDKTDDPE